MGFFRDLEDFAKGIVTTVGGIVDDVASAIARPLGVHPDVVKVAAAALGVYHSAGGFVTAAGEAVSEAAAADLIAAHGAEALAASNQMAAAAELAAATGTALPYAVDPAQLAATLAAEGNIAAATQIATTAGVSTAPIVDSLIASGQYDAAAQLTMATNPMELGFVNQKIGLAKTAADTVTASPVIASPLAAPSVLASDTLGASLSGLTSEQIAAATSANALAPTTAGANAVNALAPVFDPASALETQLTATPSTAVMPVFDPASAMETQLTATGTPAAVSPAAVTPATTNALAPTFDPASAMETQLTATPDVTGLPPGAFDTLAKFAKDYGVPLASLISGITGSQAAQSAAETQARSAAEARQLARDIFNEQKALQEPFRTAGISAQNQLLTLLGLPGGTQGAEYGRYARPFGMQDFQADPGYAFRLSEGMKALEASRAAKGGLLSGATGKALSRYGQDLASQEYGNAFNRFQTERVNRLQPLGALMGTGQAAASNQGAAAGQYGQTAGGLTTDIGAVTAGGQLGAARAISNALSAYGNYMGNQNLAQAIRESQYNR